MDENKTPKFPKNKKSLGMLIMILALVLVAVILIVVIVTSSGGSDVTTPASSAETTPVDTSSEETPDSSSTPDSSEETPDSSTVTSSSKPDDPVVPVDPVDPVQPSTGTADESGKVTVDSNKAADGLLIKVDSTKPYAYDPDNRYLGTHEAKKEDVEAAGYYILSENDVMKLSAVGRGHFLRKEALEAFAAMVKTFDGVAGTDRPFVVAGYTAETALTNTLITGNVIQVKIQLDDKTYNFDYSALKVTVGEETMTYAKWFETNCVKYGFVYEGMVGMSGEFRYVGTVHAAGIAAAGSLDAYLAGIKGGTVTSVTVGEETWNLSYTAAAQEATTEIEVGANATYLLSGDNMGGFIVAVKAAPVTE